MPAAISSRRRSSAADPVLSSAVELARAAAEEIAEPGEVGEHLEAVTEADRLVTHYFACASPGYRGWRWAVTLARVPRGRVATVCEAVLLPGPDALLAPEWLPWSERLRPGDLGVGDLLPTAPDDPRLQPGYAPTGDEDADAVALWELGLGRPRVLSPEGRAQAAERWYDGEHGPHSPIAEAAPARCASCGFFVPMAGALRRVFGVCANEYSPADGRVVSLDHGCGAHSEAVTTPAPAPVDPPVVDDHVVEVAPGDSGQ